MLVKVWNDNIHPHAETFKGDKWEIPAGGYVEMEEDEAQLFLGQFTPIVKKGDGTNDPMFFKKLRIEAPERKTEVNPLMFHATGQVAKNIEELKKLQEQYSHMLVKDDDKKVDNLIAENKSLNDRLRDIEEHLKQLTDKKRPKKVKEDEDVPLITEE